MLPGGWEIASLDELYDFSNGINADKSAFGSGVPFINVLEVITRETLDDSLIPGRVTLPAATVKRYQVRHGDVLFNRTSETQDEVALSSVYLGDSEPVFGGFVFRAQPKTKRLLTEYAAFALRARYVREQVVGRGQGGIRANVSQRDLKATRVLLPSIKEQQAITEALADASEHIAALEKAIAKVGPDKVTGQAMYDALLANKYTEEELKGALPTVAYDATAPFPVGEIKTKAQVVVDGKITPLTDHWIEVPKLDKW